MTDMALVPSELTLVVAVIIIIFIRCSALSVINAAVSVSESVATNCEASATGGFLASTASDVSLTGTTVTGCHARLGGMAPMKPNCCFSA